MNEHCRGCIRYLKSCSGMSKAVCEKHKLRIPRTKADCIRQMSDEDLANKLYLGVCVRHFDDSYECKDNGCRKCWLEWLRQEAE